MLEQAAVATYSIGISVALTAAIAGGPTSALLFALGCFAVLLLALAPYRAGK